MWNWYWILCFICNHIIWVLVIFHIPCVLCLGLSWDWYKRIVRWSHLLKSSVFVSDCQKTRGSGVTWPTVFHYYNIQNAVCEGWVKICLAMLTSCIHQKCMKLFVPYWQVSAKQVNQSWRFALFLFNIFSTFVLIGY